MATATTSKSRAAKAAALNAEQATAAEVAADEAKTTEVAEAPKQETESQKRNRLRNEAERIIINRHKSEFEDVATELFAANGLKFNKRMSEEEKAKAKIEELIKANPALKDALLATLLPAQQAPAQAEPAVAYNPAPQPVPAVAYAEGEGYGEDQFATPADPWAGHEVEAREGE